MTELTLESAMAQADEDLARVNRIVVDSFKTIDEILAQADIEEEATEWTE